VAEQQYLPDRLAGRMYYEPGERGAEAAIAVRLAEIRRRLRGE
jgi:replication-associated recombination protein RarA